MDMTKNVCMLQLTNACIAIPQKDVSNIAQSASIRKVSASGLSIGCYDFADTSFLVFQLSDELTVQGASSLDTEIKMGEFCVALNNGTDSEQHLALTCSKVESIDLSKYDLEPQVIPSFMCSKSMLVEGLFTLEEKMIYFTRAAALSRFVMSQQLESSRHA